MSKKMQPKPLVAVVRARSPLLDSKGRRERDRECIRKHFPAVSQGFRRKWWSFFEVDRKPVVPHE